MIFSTERVSANTFEAFLFIGFLLIFAIAASAYVWIKGEQFLKTCAYLSSEVDQAWSAAWRRASSYWIAF